MKTFQNPYACAFCIESFSAASTLVTHVQTKHNTVKISEDRTKNEQDRFEDIIENPIKDIKICQNNEIKAVSTSYEETKKGIDIQERKKIYIHVIYVKKPIHRVVH